MVRKLIIIASLLGLASCATDTNYYVQDGCQLEYVDDGVFITCSNQTINIPTTERIIHVFDPCGDSGDIDELVVQLNTSQYISYYEFYGVRLLTLGEEYKTRDNQRCKFKVHIHGIEENENE